MGRAAIPVSAEFLRWLTSKVFTIRGIIALPNPRFGNNMSGCILKGPFPRDFRGILT